MVKRKYKAISRQQNQNSSQSRIGSLDNQIRAIQDALDHLSAKARDPHTSPDQVLSLSLSLS
jgi:hypothetical protein